MGCGCRKKLPTTRPARWAEYTDKSYRNASDETLISRNPRLALEPGDTVVLTSGMINHSVRGWIRNGVLVES